MTAAVVGVWPMMTFSPCLFLRNVVVAVAFSILHFNSVCWHLLGCLLHTCIVMTVPYIIWYIFLSERKDRKD